jgi:PAS domain-containing protein
MTEPTCREAELNLKIAELERENEKLRKINGALIERVESSNIQGANPYSAFEHSVVLADQVRERTEALNEALFELKTSHRALKRANRDAARANQHLIDAIESISDAFVLFDSERRIILFNSKFQNVWKGTGISIQTGFSIYDIQALAEKHGLIIERETSTGGESKVFKLANGQWVQMSERWLVFSSNNASFNASVRSRTWSANTTECSNAEYGLAPCILLDSTRSMSAPLILRSFSFSRSNSAILRFSSASRQVGSVISYVPNHHSGECLVDVHTFDVLTIGVKPDHAVPFEQGRGFFCAAFALRF